MFSLIYYYFFGLGGVFLVFSRDGQIVNDYNVSTLHAYITLFASLIVLNELIYKIVLLVSNIIGQFGTVSIRGFTHPTSKS